MSNDTIITVRGNAGSVPNLRSSEGGGQWTSFRLASTRAYRNPAGSWVEEPPLWFTVRASGMLAQRLSQVVRRGTPLVVRGRLMEEEWVDREGRPQRSTGIRADAAGVDVMGRGVITYTHAPRDGERTARTDTAEGFAAMGPGPGGPRPPMDGEPAWHTLQSAEDESGEEEGAENESGEGQGAEDTRGEGDSAGRALRDVSALVELEAEEEPSDLLEVR